jgi:hypothetical protein
MNFRSKQEINKGFVPNNEIHKKSWKIKHDELQDLSKENTGNHLKFT